MFVDFFWWRGFLDLEKAGIEFKKKLERSKKFPEISGIFQIAGITFCKGIPLLWFETNALINMVWWGKLMARSLKNTSQTGITSLDLRTNTVHLPNYFPCCHP